MQNAGAKADGCNCNGNSREKGGAFGRKTRRCGTFVCGARSPDFAEKGRNGRFSLMKSVKKYQIVGNNQNALSNAHILRAIERLRNSVHKSCKKELIPWVDYVIVSINLKNTSTSAPVRMYGTAARLGSCNCRIRRMWRK